MDHPSPASFPDPMQRIGRPVTPPHGTRPNPAYQDLLTLYAKVYGAEERLVTALEPACRTVRNGEAWFGRAARGWTTELEDWNRRLGRAAEWILQELAARLRSTPPYVPITEPLEPGGAQPTPLRPTPVTVGFQPVPNPGGRLHPDPNPGGRPHPGPDPGGRLQPGPDPGGRLHPDPNPGGRLHPDPNPGGRLHPGSDPGDRLQPGPNPGGRLHPGPNPGGRLHPGPNPGGRLHPGPNPGGRLDPGPDPGGRLQPETDPGDRFHDNPRPGGPLHQEPDPGGPAENPS